MLALPPAIPARTTAPVTPTSAAPNAQAAPSQTVAPVVVQTVSVDHTPSRTDLLVNTAQWTWQELRDYVAAEIIARFGPFPRDARREYSIFNRFLTEHGQDGIAVARFAFGPVCDGWWGNAPISINRFCKKSDPYFVKPILARLAETSA